MEEEKADQLYRLFKHVDAGARRKQGLGLGSEQSQPRTPSFRAAPDPTLSHQLDDKQRGGTNASSSGGDGGGDSSYFRSLSSTFVKAGAAPAAGAAPRMLNIASQAEDSDHIQIATRSRSPKRHRSSPKEHETERDDKHRRDGHETGSSRHRSSDHGEERRHRSSRYDDERRGRQRSSRFEGQSDGHHSNRHHGYDERHTRRYEHSDNGSFRNEHGRHHRSTRREQSSSPKHTSRVTSHAKKEDPDKKLIPGYDQMSAADKVKAKMRLALDKADESARIDNERSHEIDDGRGWTRHVFDTVHTELESDVIAEAAALEHNHGTIGHTSAPMDAWRVASSSGAQRKKEALKRAAEQSHDDAIFGKQSTVEKHEKFIQREDMAMRRQNNELTKGESGADGTDGESDEETPVAQHIVAMHNTSSNWRERASMAKKQKALIHSSN